MEEYLKKEDFFFERDENGSLLPIEVTLKALPNKPKAMVTPICKGELSKLMVDTKGETDLNTDVKIVVGHSVNPKFEEKDIEELNSKGKSLMVNALSTAILSISLNVEQEVLLEAGKRKVIESELDELKKK